MLNILTSTCNGIHLMLQEPSMLFPESPASNTCMLLRLVSSMSGTHCTMITYCITWVAGQSPGGQCLTPTTHMLTRVSIRWRREMGARPGGAVQNIPIKRLGNARRLPTVTLQGKHPFATWPAHALDNCTLQMKASQMQDKSFVKPTFSILAKKIFVEVHENISTSKTRCLAGAKSVCPNMSALRLWSVRHLLSLSLAAVTDKGLQACKL